MKLIHKVITYHFTKYIFIGIFNLVWGYSTIIFLIYVLGISAYISNALTFFLGLIVTYVLNRKYTFKSTASKKKEVLRFYIAFLIAYSANLLALKICIHPLAIDIPIAQAIASGVYVLFSFPLLKFYVYKNSKNVL